ncbi:oligosaccharide flippase family protein [Shewanella sp. M16]|uniref:lipopolysaccharide biosynthesis protein n=1 Tax=Shewanella sp. M16 TaxID=2830837 RepID=UPI001BAF9478|nr:oligosaccharide flippase family protein [Shewanella sp. M16]MBS0043586.1 oligosaccharide flippase family protein [Shewanella sp. M16]
MKNKSFSLLKGFISRGGLPVLGSGIFVKIASLFLSVIVARMLTREEFGAISFALMIVTPLIPLSGAGLDVAFLRFSSLIDDEISRVKLYWFSMLHGIYFCVFLIFIFYIVIFANNLQSESRYLYLVILSLLLFSDFILRMIQSFFRVDNNNSQFAYTGVARVIVLCITSVIFIYIYGPIGYAFSLVLSPFIVFLIFLNKIPIKLSGVYTLKSKKSDYYRYGIETGMGAVISQLPIPIAGILLGLIMGNDSDVASYKIVSLIPLTLLFIPQLFFKSEFVFLTRNHTNCKLILEYLKSYIKVNLLFCGLVLLVTYFWGDFIVECIFGSNYAKHGFMLFLLTLGAVGGLLLRQPFGNLNFASGRSDLNVYNSILTLIINLSLLYFFIGEFGLLGACIGTAITFWVSGLINLLTYFHYVFNRLTHQ